MYLQRQTCFGELGFGFMRHAGWALLGLCAVVGPLRAAEQCVVEQTLTASNGAAGDSFGQSVSLSGDTIVVGAHAGDGAVADSGAAYVYVVSPGELTEQQKLTASDGATGDGFGWSVSVSGDTAVVGALFGDAAGVTNSGSAYVYVRSGGVWMEQQKLTASDASASDQFGMSVSISGNTIVVGAGLDHNGGMGGIAAGSAYVFVRSGGGVERTAEIDRIGRGLE